MSAGLDPVPEPESRAARMREERRAQIVAAAKEVFAERGYHSASVNDVIERAGIARGTFYLYFTGKSQLFETLTVDALAALRARIRPIDIGPAAPPPETQLRGMLGDVLGAAVADRHFTLVLLSLWMNPDVDVAESVRGFYDRLTALIATSLERGIAKGLVRPCEPALLAPVILGLVRGAVEHLLVAPDPPPIAAVVDALISFAMSGIGAPERWT